MATFNVQKLAFARERLTVTNAVKTLTAATYNPSDVMHRATGARVQLLTGSGDITFTEQGTDPTADNTTVSGVGTSASAGGLIYLESYGAIAAFKAIRVSADAILEVTYYR